MPRRHLLLLGWLAFIVTPVALVGAAELQNFDAKAFAAAQEAGQSVVVAINAPW
jgi:hypothetical protein